MDLDEEEDEDDDDSVLTSQAPNKSKRKSKDGDKREQLYRVRRRRLTCSHCPSIGWVDRPHSPRPANSMNTPLWHVS